MESTKLRYREMSKNFPVGDEKWDSIASRAYKAHEKRRYYETLEKILMESLKSLSRQKNMRGDVYALFRSERKGNIIYSDIPELKNIDLELYRGKPISIWKLVTI